MDRGLLDEFLYRLYGMYVAVLAARMAASQGDQPGHGDSLVPDHPRPRPPIPYPWDNFVGPLPWLQSAINHGSGQGPAVMTVAPSLHPRLGPLGPGAGLDAGNGGGLLG